MLQDQRSQFFRSVAGQGFQETLAQVEAVIATNSMSETFAENGEFLPLGVWATRGFNATDIETLTEPGDKKVHPILGMTYRVRIDCTQFKRKREITRRSQGSANVRPPRFSELQQPTVLAIEDAR
jgi:hypothetical protein